jgi:hypothetical protein
MPTFFQNYLAVRNTAEVTGGKPIAVLWQSISDLSAVNPLVAFYDIHGRKGAALFALSRTPHEIEQHNIHPSCNIICWEFIPMLRGLRRSNNLKTIAKFEKYKIYGIDTSRNKSLPFYCRRPMWRSGVNTRLPRQRSRV